MSRAPWFPLFEELFTNVCSSKHSCHLVSLRSISIIRFFRFCVFCSHFSYASCLISQASISAHYWAFGFYLTLSYFHNEFFICFEFLLSSFFHKFQDYFRHPCPAFSLFIYFQLFWNCIFCSCGKFFILLSYSSVVNYH